MNALVGKLRRMAEDKALPIGEAWNALDEAADALEEAQAAVMDEWHDVRTAPPSADYHDGWNAALLRVAEIIGAPNTTV